MRLPEPFSCFCRDADGRFDYHEWHAILIGIADGLQPWRPDDKSCEAEHHYYIVARGLTTAAVVLSAILILRRRK